MNHYTAFIFDLNGTMIDDMKYHISAWHRILNGLGASLSMERVREECYGKNDELLERVFPGRFTDDEKRAMSLEKERQYQEAFFPQLKLIPGLAEFLASAGQRGIKMAIGSAAIRYNIDFVLDNLQLQDYFDVLISADDVEQSKPDPETFVRCAEGLEAEPEECIVFEDSPKGVEAAGRAGMKAVVITTLHAADEFDGFKNVLYCVKDFSDLRLQELF